MPASTCTLQRASNSPSPRDADEARSRLGANNTGTKGYHDKQLRYKSHKM